MLGAGVRLGSYAVVEALGRGGMGVVYKARDEKDGRIVAIKIISPEVAKDTRFLERFRREADALAALRVPGVVAHLGVGEAFGSVYLVLEYLPGGTLKARLKERGALPWREAVALAEPLAEALAAVHAAGLIHRDVKPENVLLDAAGNPKLADFGLVRAAGAATLTKTSDVIGTPEYMAPEQASPESRRAIDARADLYSLGATLYALLTGEPPFVGQGFALVRRVLLEAPAPPSKKARDVPPGLDALVLRLLAKEPGGRPQSAAQVAADLRALRAHERPRRRAGVVLGAVLALGVSAAVALGRATKEPPRAPPLASPPPAPVVPKPVVPTRPVLPALCEPILDTELFRLRALHRPFWWRHRKTVTGIAVSGDGRKAASASLDGTVQVWDVATWTEERSIPHPDRLNAVAFLPDGRLVAGSDDGAIYLSGREGAPAPVAGERHRARVNAVAVTPDGARAASAGDDGQLKLWDLASGRLIQTFEESRDAVYAVAFSRDGETFIAGGAHRTVTVWDGTGKTASVMATLGSHGDTVQVVAVSPDGERAATGGLDGRVRIWDLKARNAAVPPLEVNERIRGVAFTPDGTRILAGDDAGHLSLWDPAEPRTRLRDRNAHVFANATDIEAVAVTPDGRFALTAGYDSSVGRFELPSLERASSDLVRQVAWSPDGKLLAASGFDGTITLEERSTGRRARFVHDAPVTALAFAPGGERMAAGCEDGRLLVWNAAGFLDGTGAPFSPREFLGGVRGLGFSGDGKLLLAGTSASEGELVVLDAATGVVVTARGGVRSIDAGLVIDRRIVVATETSIPLFDLRNDQIVDAGSPLNHGARMHGLAASGERILSGGDRGSVRLWRPGSAPFDLRGAEGAIWNVALDATRAYAGGEDGVHVWALPGGKEIDRLDLSPLDDYACAVAVARDGSLAVGTARGAVLVYEPKGK